MDSYSPKLPREVVVLPSLEVFRRCVYVVLKDISGGLDSIRLMFGLGYLKGHFQSK